MNRNIEARLRKLEAALAEEKERKTVIAYAKDGDDISPDIRAEVAELESSGIDVTLIVVRYSDTGIALRNLHQSHQDCSGAFHAVFD